MNHNSTVQNEDDNLGLNISKLIPTSINQKFEELVDGQSNEPQQYQQQSTLDSSYSVLGGCADDESKTLDKPNDKPHIGTKAELEPDNIWNKHIYTGYRINYTSWNSILHSIFEIHNETVNIWTHLSGFIIYVVVLLVFGLTQMGEDVSPSQSSTTQSTIEEFFTTAPNSVDFGFIESQKAELTLFLGTIEYSLYQKEIQDGSYMPRFHTGFAHSEQVSKWPIVAYLFTALFCLGCSTICHWLADKDKSMLQKVATLDYWGITILILGTSYPFISYRYACGYLVVYRYVFVVILTVLNVTCMIVTMNPTFLKPTPKAVLFITFGIFCLVPTITLYILNDPENGMKPGLDPFTWSTLFYLIGLTFYVTKFPERQSKTGKFDILFNSHQIHHICVLLGITIAFFEVFEVYQKRLEFVCPDQQQVPVA